MNIFPSHWEAAPLEQLLSHVIGGDWGKDTDFEDSDFVPVVCIRGTEFKNWSTEFGATSVFRKIKKTSLNNRQLSNGDIILEISGGGPEQPVGRVVLIGNKTLDQFELPVVCTNFLRLLRPSQHTIPNYLHYFLEYFYQSGEVIKYQGGSNNLRNLIFKDYSGISIPLPPLAEQQEIARQLDTLLAQVEHTQARLQRIPDILKRFRQSVLADAVSGKLTKEWRRNNANVKPLNSHDRITEFRGRKLDELPETWGWLEFKRVAEIASNLVDPSENLEAVHIAPNHIESWTGTVSNYLTIRDDGVTSPKHLFFEGQIIYSKIRPYLAKVAVAEFEGLCSADMYPINSLINTKYLFRWMLTSTFTDWASNAESRSVLPKINQKDLNVIPVPTPPLEEQTQIVIRVEQLFAYADRIEQQAQAALERVNLLSQSILAKAFRGELTADWRAANPDLISGENSAEALLAKIKAEKKSSKKSSKGT